MEIPLLPEAGNEADYPINCWLNPQGESGLPCIQKTPGLSQYFQTTAAVEVRGMWDMDGVLYVVAGNKVYTYDGSNKTTLTGTLDTSTGQVWMKDNATQVMIVDGSGYGYIAASGAVTKISDVDFPSAQGLAFQDGYFITIEKDTQRLWISALNDGTSWATLEYENVNTEPDDAVVPISDHREIHVLGEDTIEVYYNSGDANFPFTRISHGHQDKGISAPLSVGQGDNSYFWLSSRRQVLRAAGLGASPTVISTRRLDQRFMAYTTISDAFGYCMDILGCTWYVLTFPTENETWVFNTTTGRWHRWSSYPTTPSVLRHRSNCHCYFDGKNLVGDFENGWVYYLNKSAYSDDSYTIRSVLTIGPIQSAGKDIIHYGLEAKFKAGIGSSTGLATGTAVMSAGAVASVTIVSGGSGYTDEPNVIFSGGGGSGAYATTTLTSGVVTAVTIVAGGSGYTSTPTVTFVGGTEDPQAMLQWSDDRMRTWSNQHWRSIGKIGEYDFRTRWLRLGRSTQRFYQIIVTDAVEMVIEGLYLDGVIVK